MRDQEVLDLYEAYASIYASQEEVEQLDEGRTTSLRALARETERKKDPAPGAYNTDRRLALRSQSPSAFKFEKDPETGNWSNVGRRDTNTTEDEVRKKVSQRSLRRRNRVPQKGGRPMFESSSDLFDTILEHLVAEGYADTNEAALVIMANMSEEWKQSIVEQNAIVTTGTSTNAAGEKIPWTHRVEPSGRRTVTDRFGKRELPEPKLKGA